MNFLDSRLPDRFWSKRVPEPNSGCWLWIGAHDEKGYSLIGWNGKTGKGHQIAYRALVGGIPPGLEIDHRVCSTRDCVNPAHMLPVTHKANVARGDSGRERRDRTHCRMGHEYSNRNTRIAVKNGRRYRACRECDRLRMAATRSRR